MCRNRVQSPSTMSHSASMVYSICAFWIHIYVILSMNTSLSIDEWFQFVLFSLAASYGVEDPEFAITQLAQTTMRSELGKMSLDKVFRERESLNVSIVDSINKAALAWGITCLRYEIRDIKVCVLAARNFVRSGKRFMLFFFRISATDARPWSNANASGSRTTQACCNSRIRRYSRGRHKRGRGKTAVPHPCIRFVHISGE